MTNNAFTPERIAQSREILAKATPGPWETDTEKTDGEYGSGPDCPRGYHASIITAGDKRICGTENSADGEVHEEFDEDGCYAWDEVAARNMKAAAHAVNTHPAALDEIERLQAENADFAEQLALRSETSMAKDMQEIMAQNNALSASLTLANARIARLEEALRPFANYADAVEGNLRFHGVAYTPDYRKAVFVEDFRRARAALKGDA